MTATPVEKADKKAPAKSATKKAATKKAAAAPKPSAPTWVLLGGSGKVSKTLHLIDCPHFTTSTRAKKGDKGFVSQEATAEQVKEFKKCSDCERRASAPATTEEAVA